MHLDSSDFNARPRFVGFLSLRTSLIARLLSGRIGKCGIKDGDGIEGTYGSEGQ